MREADFISTGLHSTDMRTTPDNSAPGATPRDATASIGFATTMLFAVACGALAANLYYAQPLVALIGDSMGLSVSVESTIFTAAQIGYVIGLVFLVPLGDIVENRKLIVATMALNVVALAGLGIRTGPDGALRHVADRRADIDRRASDRSARRQPCARRPARHGGGKCHDGPDRRHHAGAAGLELSGRSSAGAVSSACRRRRPAVLVAGLFIIPRRNRAGGTNIMR